MYTKGRDSGTEQDSAEVGLVANGILASVLDRITDGVLVVDGEGTIVYVNKPLCTLFGYPADELVGASVERPLTRQPPCRAPRARRTVSGVARAPADGA